MRIALPFLSVVAATTGETGELNVSPPVVITTTTSTVEPIPRRKVTLPAVDLDKEIADKETKPIPATTTPVVNIPTLDCTRCYVIRPIKKKSFRSALIKKVLTNAAKEAFMTLLTERAAQKENEARNNSSRVNCVQ